MPVIEFTKLVAAGNDFVLVDNVAGNWRFICAEWQALAKKLCGRKYGAGADGLLLLEPSQSADFRMRIFNPDGSEAEMCGNGARCCAAYFSFYLAAVGNQPVKIETKAGALEAFVSGDLVKLRMPDPGNIRLNIAVNDNMSADFINTGVPHAVIFVNDLEGVDVAGLGGKIRRHNEFAPEGANVDFVKILDKGKIGVRTYERGVEGETDACGTGSVAAALIYAKRPQSGDISAVLAQTKSGEALKVSFKRKGAGFTDVFLEGSARIAYQGSLAAAFDSQPLGTNFEKRNLEV